MPTRCKKDILPLAMALFSIGAHHRRHGRFRSHFH